MNIKGETAHTAGALTALGLPEGEWLKSIINQGVIGFLEIAFNQFAISKTWVDPATIRISDPWVERVKQIRGAQVKARHIDLGEAKKYAAEFKRSTPQAAATEPIRTVSSGKAQERFFAIGSNYNFSILTFQDSNDSIPLTDLGAAHNIIMALGTTGDELERMEVTLTPGVGKEEKIVLSRGEGLRIPAVFKGKVIVRAVDAGAWAVWVTVPKSEPEAASEENIFVREGMQFAETPRDLKGPFAPQTNPIITDLIRQGKVIEVVYDEASGRLSSYKVKYVEGYIYGETEYKGEGVDINTFITNGQDRKSVV